MFDYLAFYFTDGVLRAPTIGCMLMCFIAALVGVFVVLKGRALIGETLSHATYPGVILALLVERLLFADHENEIALLALVLAGAFLSCILGVYVIELLEERYQVSQDAALSFVLSAFFGVGITLLSFLQQDFPMLYKELQGYLFGQAATLRDIHIAIYAPLAFLIVLIFILFFQELRAISFDPVFADVVGMKRKLFEKLLFFLLVFSVVIGIRSCGVVLMSAMLVFPAVTARAFTHSLSTLLILAGAIGLVSGFFGVVASHELSLYFWQGAQKTSSLPTGPVIVLVAAAFFILSLIFAKQRGFRFVHDWYFFWRVQQENLLKTMWKKAKGTRQKKLLKCEIKKQWQKSRVLLEILFYLLERRGWIRKGEEATYQFTASGAYQAKKIIHFHKLWEHYLQKKCQMTKSRAHMLAEEMEHIITPEIEKELLVESEI